MRKNVLRSIHTTLAYVIQEYEYKGYNEPIVGVEKGASINATQLLQALSAGVKPEDLILHLEPKTSTLCIRRELAETFRKNGVHALARKITRAIVPKGHVLLLVNLDTETSLRSIDLGDIVGGGVQ
jgi:hypothetical protein